ncbi:pyridoxal 5'-phosphate synthase KNAG_0F03840 [Huiozyma naganishii CBS 8797]|uniref:Pyridoxamine 5'-phosphate oxidase N-terminal domain-containing protein n=1 Tax=Huiozyma naganishii (strain ATCC MYA-139 / BCRC 22969 / CBS 8797 / KCTC 17520 / NBRC 10181 / NCYC 3082 / Yp74L-3) TaxID=1071383 RepID=J7RND5_HUIN7|nr:hypothetical protein KNAG_0F03840 [Kazachstania naganishii CBS 8797]CCK71048.1 hypothetical protein KNAG_0F03840 [Kazachstania naganishii CBS 8797]
MSCTQKFPDALLELIQTSKYVHLATASRDCIPSVSLMNYIYVPHTQAFGAHSGDADTRDYILFATFDNTEKYTNILANPVVSLLFHDWVAANKLSVRKSSTGAVLEPTREHPSKLLNLLQQLNQAELNEISATIRGHATPIDPQSEESAHYKQILLKANPDAEVFITGKNTVVVKVVIESAKVTDNENNTSVYK